MWSENNRGGTPKWARKRNPAVNAVPSFFASSRPFSWPRCNRLMRLCNCGLLLGVVIQSPPVGSIRKRRRKREGAGTARMVTEGRLPPSSRRLQGSSYCRAHREKHQSSEYADPPDKIGHQSVVPKYFGEWSLLRPQGEKAFSAQRRWLGFSQNAPPSTASSRH